MRDFVPPGELRWRLGAGPGAVSINVRIIGARELGRRRSRGPRGALRSVGQAFAVAAEIHVRHASPRVTKSCIANFESPTIAWPAFFSKRACRPRALATAASIASPPGSGTHVSTTLARLSKNANKACWARPRRKISRLTCSIVAASRSSAPTSSSPRTDSSCATEWRMNAVGDEKPRFHLYK